MNIKDDKTKIDLSPVDAVGGAKPEPEERPAERVLTVDRSSIDLKMSTGKPVDSKLIAPNGLIANTEVDYQSTAGQLARGFRSQCQYCVHFDHAAAQGLFHTWQQDLAGMQQLNDIRAAVLETQNAALIDRHAGLDGEIDPEHCLAQLGICRVLTEILNDPMIVHPMGACPEVLEDGTPFENQFQPRNRAAATTGAMLFDRIMTTAAGKGLK